MKRWTRNVDLNAGVIIPKIAAVIAVFNKSRDLALCLEGYRRQSFMINYHQEFEMILADDGSGPEVEDVFSRFADQVSFPTTYIRQEDRGWGKLRMLNWAVLESQAERLIFTDGDCIPHRHFVMSHFECNAENRVSCGRRVDLMENLSLNLTREDILSRKLESLSWLLRNIYKGEVEYGGQGFYLPAWLAGMVPAFSKNAGPTILGSNFSVHRKWLIKLNGFDETYDGPGYGEDSDLERRFKMLGLEMKWITGRAVQFHLWHPLTEVGEKAKGIYESLNKKENISALKGIKEFMPDFEKIARG